jgi:hypothetical protein
MSTSITGSQVWESLCRDVSCDESTEKVNVVLRPYIEALPTILSTMLEEKVTLETFFEAKIIFLRYLLESDFIQNVRTTFLEEAGMVEIEELISYLQESLEGLEELHASLPEVLGPDQAGAEISNATLIGSAIGFSPEVVDTYQAGELTFSKLLILQPRVIYMENV